MLIIQETCIDRSINERKDENALSGKPARRPAVIVAAGLAAAGLVAVGAAPAHATSGTLQSDPFEVGNLLNYANSDFEGTIGNWATLLDTTKWQYSQADITIPATCTYVLGSPEVILGGLAAGAAVNMDEAIFARTARR
jgi:hypothetical protein